MSHSNKISVVVLGREDYLKKALITSIPGTDLSLLPKNNDLKETEIYENNMYMVKCTPDRECDDLKKVFAPNRGPDISLLVVKEEFTPEEVWEQVDSLHRITGKLTEEFIVVLPLSCKESDSYRFKCCTMDQVFRKLTQLAEERNLIPTSTRLHDQPAASQTPTPRHPIKEGEHPTTEVNLVLLGMTGTGKSASGNTILGEKQFISRASSNPVTTECQEAKTEIGGRRVRVIDTPDIFDDDDRKSPNKEHVRRCLELCQSGPRVFLLVIHVSRFTDGERTILKKMETAFGREVVKQTVVLFTRGGDLQQGGMSFEDFLHGCQPDLKKIVEKCGGRCVLFENNTLGSDQVDKLMQIVDRMLTEERKNVNV
ncbi:GTPase IMAP family member 7 [Etheostoma spectabile]|uniref:GTPase IMAP family member 7 n=1 Tax=Etheostoma spectabile TaxID=54343 RepID=UPI0013AE9209|nr:GTPase IMAP family member 7-like [Etheostoma spectabile]